MRLLLIEGVAAGLPGVVTADAGDALPCLSPRQLDVLPLLAEGHANKEVRVRPDVAERTVSAHLTGSFATLEVRTRVDAILRAHKIGLIH